MLNFAESGHLVFRADGALERGDLKSVKIHDAKEKVSVLLEP